MISKSFLKILAFSLISVFEYSCSDNSIQEIIGFEINSAPQILSISSSSGIKYNFSPDEEIIIDVKVVDVDGDNVKFNFLADLGSFNINSSNNTGANVAYKLPKQMPAGFLLKIIIEVTDSKQAKSVVEYFLGGAQVGLNIDQFTITNYNFQPNTDPDISITWSAGGTGFFQQKLIGLNEKCEMDLSLGFSYYTANSNETNTICKAGGSCPSQFQFDSLDDKKKYCFVIRDNLGQDAIREAILISDQTAPIAFINPNIANGKFPVAQAVQFGCNDNYDCDEIAYRVEKGSVPVDPSFSTGDTLFTVGATAVNLGNQGNGTYTLKYLSRDKSGNLSTINTETFIIDSNAPYVTISSNNNNFVSETGFVSSTFSWSSNKIGTYELKLGNDCSVASPYDGNTYSYAIANTLVNTVILASALLTGNNTLKICFTTDTAITGEASLLLVKDNTSPISSISSLGGSYTGIQQLELSCNDNCTKIVFTLDGSDPSINASGIVINGQTYSNKIITPYGATTIIKYLSIDKSGNIEANVQSQVYSIATPNYLVNVNVMGLTGNLQLSNKGNLLAVTTNGISTFTNSVNNGDNYAVAVVNMPSGQVCTVSDPKSWGSSTSVDVTVNINCIDGYMVGGHFQLLQPAPLGYFLYQGKLSLLAGDGSANYVDGAGASFSSPKYMALLNNSLFISDANNSKLRKVDLSTNITSTVAGNGSTNITMSNQTICSDSLFFLSSPNLSLGGIVTNGTKTYLAESENSRILQITNLGTTSCSIIALTPGGASTAVDGEVSIAKFNFINGLALKDNVLYISDTGNHKIRVIDLATGIVSTLAGTGTQADVDSTVGLSASFDSPRDIVVIGNDLYVLSQYNIRKISLSGSNLVTTVVGSTTSQSGFKDANGTEALFRSMFSMTSDGSSLFISDSDNLRVRKVDIKNNYRVTTLLGGAGNGTVSDVGITAQINKPYGIISDGRNIYVSDYGNHAIRKISDNGLVGYWPLAGNTFDYNSDAVNGAKNISLTGGSPILNTGRYGEQNGAYLFNGSSDYFEASSANLPTSSSIRSICVWIKPNSLPTSSWNIVVGYGAASSGNGLSLGLGYNSTIGNFITFSGYGDDINAHYNTPTTSWTHLCGLFNGLRASLYINGKKMVSGAVTWSTTNGNLRIGRQINGNVNEYFNGNITDLRIYNRELNESEINELAQDALPSLVGNSYNTAALGLLSHYSFDDSGTAPTLFDSGPLNKTLTNNGAAAATGKDGDTNGAFTFSNQYLNWGTMAYGLPVNSHPRTLCSWIKPSAYPASGQWKVFLSYGQSGVKYQTSSLGLYNNSGVVNVQFMGWSDNLSLAYAPPLNSWTHICGTYDNNKLATLYVNGENMGSQLKPFWNTRPINGLIIARQTSGIEKFLGAVDDVRIYNKALSQMEIRQLAIQVPTGLVARYDFMGDSNDVSGWGNNLIAQGGNAPMLTSNRFNRDNSSYSFNNGYLKSQTADLATLQLPTGSMPRTQCAWVKVDASMTTRAFMIDWGTTATNLQSALGYDPLSGKYRFTANNAMVESSATFIKAQWQHICGVYLGGSSSVFIYVNGVILGSQAVTWATTTGHLFIGVLSNMVNNTNLIGLLDDVRVYNRALSVAEINSIYATPPKKIFVTYAAFQGDIGSISNADAKCMADTRKPADGSIYKAMFVDGSNRRACLSANCGTSGSSEHIDWVFSPLHHYFRFDDNAYIATTSNIGLLPSTISNKLATTLNALEPDRSNKAWSGLQPDWLFHTTNNCNNWSSNASGVFGANSDFTVTSNYIGITGGDNCSRNLTLICVEQ